MLFSVCAIDCDCSYRNQLDCYKKPAFLYRCMVKSLWHWLNFEKIPRFTVPETYIDGDGKTFHVGGIVILPAPMDLMYKLLHVPLFVGALRLLFCWKLSLKEAVFFVPYFALWPVVVLLFPDTRFKICAVIMAVIPMMRALEYGVRKYPAQGDLNLRGDNGKPPPSCSGRRLTRGFQ